MSFWRSTMIKKTRKPHTCIFCSRIIPTGNEIEENCGVWGGEFQHYYFCTRCRKFIDEYDVCLEDGFSEGDFFDYALSHLDTVCQNCKSYRLDHDWSEDTLICTMTCTECGHEFQIDFSMEGK